MILKNIDNFLYTILGFCLFIYIGQTMPKWWMQIYTNVSPLKPEENIKANNLFFQSKESLDTGKVSNIYYLKIAKSGSTTFANVLARYAWNHNLSVATMKRAPIPKNVDNPSQYFLDSLVPPFIDGKSEKYHMFLDHSNYVPGAIRTILQEPVTYVSLIRNPARKVVAILSLKGKQKSVSYFKRLEECSDCNMTRPLTKSLTEWFGIASGEHYLTEHLKTLNKLFFVGITEYFSETMVLLRRKFGWSFKDILYYPIHVHNYTAIEMTENLYNKICKVIPDDCVLYEYFNKSFWTMVNKERGGFSHEVIYFKSIIQKIYEFCTPAFKSLNSGSPVDASTQIGFDGSMWNKPFNFTYMECSQSFISSKGFRPLFFYRQNRRFGCDKNCNLNLVRQKTCEKICQASKLSASMQLFPNAVLRPLLN